jgi:hypothetical protein
MRSIVLLTAIIAASATTADFCRGQSNVYSIGGSSSFEPAPHNPDEVMVGSYTYEAASRSYRVEWYVSTNLLAKQPHWDGVSAEAPLSAGKACALALKHARGRFPQVRSWSLKSLSLRNPLYDDTKGYPGVWCYEIILAPRDAEARNRMDQEASYFAGMEIVLLDGTEVPSVKLKKR